MTPFHRALCLSSAIFVASAIFVGCHSGDVTDPIIQAGAVDSVAVTPTAPLMLIGDTLRFTATPKGTGGAVVTTNITTTRWTSSDTLVAVVTSSGLVTALSTGITTISAVINGLAGNASVSVTAKNLALTFTAVSAGQTHSCGLTPAGAAFCWGDNAAGELGVNAAAPAIPTAVSGGLTFAAVSAGGFHSCAITAAGAAWCWGDNTFGELGANSPLGSTSSPLAVSGGLAFKLITLGGSHSCGLTAAGAAWCWGNNAEGQLGTGNTTNSSVPIAVAGGLTFTTLSAGLQHTCGITTSGAAFCWGDLNTLPSAIPGGLVFATISAGASHSCALTAAGAAFCWGDNTLGELGAGSSIQGSGVPVAVSGGLAFSAISAGTLRSCALTVAGAPYCWGNNQDGGLGAGTTAVPASNIPVAVTDTSLIYTGISAGQLHACGVTTTNIGFCWGNNQYGQLGNGTLVASAVPVRS